MKPTPRRNIGGSILPSSSPQVLAPLAFRNGTLQVRVLPEADTHGLFWDRDGLSSLIATHGNGYSCRSLADRMASDDAALVREQAEYILRCGGTCQQIENVCEMLAN